jgi:hypothetical protein
MPSSILAPALDLAIAVVKVMDVGLFVSPMAMAAIGLKPSRWRMTMRMPMATASLRSGKLNTGRAP